MSGETLIVVLPLISLILASLSIAGLWYWWTSGKQAEDNQDAMPQTGVNRVANDTTSPSSGEVNTDRAESALEGKSLVEMFDGAMDFLDTQLSRLLSNRIESQISTQSFDLPPSAPEQVYQQPPPPPVPPPSSSPVAHSPLPSAPASAPGQSVEAMRVLRDLADGSLIIEVDGRQYRNASQITDPDIYRRLSGNMQALMTFLMEKNMPQPDNYPPPSMSPSPVSSPPEPRSQPIRSATAGKDEQEESSQPETMGGQIESLLQYRLTLTPPMAARSIHIRDAGAGVMIEIDGHYYDSVADVPDFEVREFIQNVIREWEARQ